jgi:hypothetical protein
MFRTSPPHERFNQAREPFEHFAERHFVRPWVEAAAAAMDPEERTTAMELADATRLYYRTKAALRIRVSVSGQVAEVTEITSPIKDPRGLIHPIGLRLHDDADCLMLTQRRGLVGCEHPVVISRFDDHAVLVVDVPKVRPSRPPVDRTGTHNEAGQFVKDFADSKELLGELLAETQSIADIHRSVAIG